MVDLSHWDFQAEFELSEVAALIAGVEPKYGKKAMFGDSCGIPSPISKRVLDAVEAAFVCQRKQNPVPADCLQSNMFDIFYKKKGVLGTVAELVLGGDDVVVQRDEVARWLDAIGMKSVYRFQLNGGLARLEPIEAPEKPLGTTERNTLLTIIAALAKEAKINIDPPGKAAGYIEGLTAELGAPVSKRAIEEHLKKIQNALETRMK